MALIVIIIGIVLFVLGFLLLIQSYTATPAADKVVGVSEFEKVQSELKEKADSEVMLKTQLDKLSVQLDEATNAQADANQKQITIDQLTEEEHKKEDALHKLEHDMKAVSEIADSQAQRAADLINELNKEKVIISEIADSQAERAADLIGQLQSENASLQEKIKELEDRADPQEINVLREKNTSLESLTQDYLAQLEAMKDDLNEKTRKSRQVIDALNQRNGSLKEALLTMRERIDAASSSFDALKQGQDEKTSVLDKEAVSALEDRIKGYEEKVGQLEDVLQQSQDEANKAKMQVEEVADRYREVQNQLEQERKRVKTSRSNSSLTRDWQEEKIQLEKNINTLQQERSFLVDKDKMLEEELVKSRAKTMGLEKICLQLKKQLELQEKGR